MAVGRMGLSWSTVDLVCAVETGGKGYTKGAGLI
jgi:hypothetical protein